MVLSASLYLVEYLIFKDPRYIATYFLGSLAFVPIEILVISVIVDQLLRSREKRALIQKLNMVIGTFYSEVGTELLAMLSENDPKSEEIRKELLIKDDWAEKDFINARKRIKKRDFQIKTKEDDYVPLKDYLLSKRVFLITLLENPNLLEHDTFTNLLWAVFHLYDELAHRTDVNEIIETDRNHLDGDSERAYGLLVSEWLDYMNHLRLNYPYLFSLALRTNPFNPNAKAEVTN